MGAVMRGRCHRGERSDGSSRRTGSVEDENEEDALEAVGDGAPEPPSAGRQRERARERRQLWAADERRTVDGAGSGRELNREPKRRRRWALSGLDKGRISMAGTGSAASF